MVDNEFIDAVEEEKKEEPQEKSSAENKKIPLWITTGFILLLIFISMFAYVFFTNLYYVKNHACIVCVEKNDAECYLNNKLYYMENDEVKSHDILLQPNDLELTSEWN